ncbi:TIP41-like protein [Pyrus x bretschneideri]|uniref:TIP41-like protein n=1 Tax=Pyrus x bretschneideri TaxID=225117 RepID=UPI00202E67CA|nr:TIP41-like protein [Pyrus x bretschneideri]
MEVEVDDKELKAAGAEPLSDGRYGLCIHGWDIESRKRLILSSSNTEPVGAKASYLSHAGDGVWGQWIVPEACEERRHDSLQFV